MPLAHSCVFFQTLTAKRVKTRYNFRFFEGLETNRASNLSGKISQERLHCQRSTRSLVNTAWKSYCLKFREKQDVVEWPYELKLNIFRNWAIITQSRFCCRRSWPIRFLFIRLRIYESHIFELRIKMWMKVILAVMCTTWAVEKKFRPVRDLNPWPLRYRCSALPTELTSQLLVNVFTHYWLRILAYIFKS